MVGSNQFKELCIMAYHGALWWFMIIHVEQKHATNIATTYHQKSNHDPASWELTLSPTKVTCEGWFSFSRWDMSVNSQFPWIFSRPSCHHLLWGRSEWHSSGSTPDSAAQRRASAMRPITRLERWITSYIITGITKERSQNSEWWKKTSMNMQF